MPIAYAHTAEDAHGKPDPDESRWQPLRTHLENVAKLAAKFAAPFGALQCLVPHQFEITTARI